MTFKILVVDDEKNIRMGLGKSLEMEGYEVYLAENGNEAMKEMLKTSIDLVVSDLKMPGMSGEELLKKITTSYPTVPVIILTGHGTVENAVDSMRNGAFDFLTKPVNLDRLGLLVKRALSTRRLIVEHQALQKEVERLEKKKDRAIIGRSGALDRVLELVEQVAQTKVSVLITGESGVGKELVADAIHNASSRREKPFIKVHCAALSESLLESELFGHEKGSFTGASSQRKGRFELADGGTIFLDEIGEINPSVQIKILRVLQEKTFERVGGEKTIHVDTRIIAATNRDLKEEVEKGHFREDLYYRLNVVNIHVPPLRERKDDIPLLTSAFLEQFAGENEKNIEGIDNKASTMLYNYNWPGNIRELRNCMESAVVLCKKHIIGPDDLPPGVRSNEEEGVIRIELGTSMAEAEKIIIRQTLKGVNNNKSRASELLGIGRKTLHRKIHDYGLEEEFLTRG
ncbi:MAG: sigma-54-dependent Fis family transcriptional regulator [Deltaproteobacteria bacterium]|nr:sigma-54-dependent Fis family transcriptional regulator [Deltaproteobacteria bacterium]